ncbi:metal-dependent hydrolase [Pseudalkalibacillus hwajinpoensis]|uniref:Metal-dependent hydrolase n=1 Tax=Guptibacillus hwajinpoensis TaxID=208199 RepID=A0A4U1MDW5_9BACL|nr:metal-dependent hydrolase [Pseudalkalibacillus hwajinpoensis]TKD68340.1 metal-dependent hydrolase [Pseudalkalibacillus hwajinpoensis]
MDTGTHVVMGLGIGALATLDPAIAQDPITAQSVLIGALIGSQAPDFDTVLKLKNNAVYIRHHRGITHSIPAVLTWPIIISSGIMLFYPETNWLHLWLWTFLAVFIHVFVDIFNAYGTQAIRPFSNRWVALGVINIFDPFIFLLHIGGLILWYTGTNPGYTFLTIYGVIIFYYFWRIYEQRKVINAVKERIPAAIEIIVSPTISWSRWHIAVKSESNFYVARADGTTITVQDEFERVPVPKTPVLESAKEDPNLSAFLSFSPVYRWEIEEKEAGYEVRFIDLRYRNKGHYPFVAVVQMEDQLEITSSYTGWVYSEDTLRKKLDIALD